MNRKIRILIVDDSRIFRSIVEESLSAADDIQVIGSVWNGAKAIEFIRSNPTDLVTLDLEMPEMEGIETLRAIQKINVSKSDSEPIGVIMLSSYTRRGADITIKALEMGAFDFIPKPEAKTLGESIEILRRQLVVKIRHFASRRISSGLGEAQILRPAEPEIRPELSFSSGIRAIMVGASTGGPKALGELLPPLCDKVDVPIFVVQHMPPTFTQSLAKSLNARCRYTVIEAAHADIVRERHVYIAPGGRHMLIGTKNETIMTVIGDQLPENGCRPSVDVLFRSGAGVYGADTVAVILTGMGTDGTKGARILKRAGAVVVAQDEETSVVWGMPGNAANSGSVDKILPLGDIPSAVIAMVLDSNRNSECVPRGFPPAQAAGGERERILN